MLHSDQEEPSNVLLQKIVANLNAPELDEMQELIDSVIDEEASFSRKTSQRMLECLFAVRSKVRG